MTDHQPPPMLNSIPVPPSMKKGKLSRFSSLNNPPSQMQKSTVTMATNVPRPSIMPGTKVENGSPRSIDPFGSSHQNKTASNYNLMSDDKPQTIVDELFKDFISKKMYAEANRVRPVALTIEDEKLAQSVEEMNRMLDEEILEIINKPASKTRDALDTGPVNPSPADNVIEEAPSQVLKDRVTKKASGMKLGIKISQTSATLIATGEMQTTKGKHMEDGEVASSNGDSGQDDLNRRLGNDNDHASDEDDDDEISGTGSLSDSDKGGKSSSKSKKKKHKHKKKKHKTKDKKKEEVKSTEGNKRKHKSRSRSRSPKRRERSRSRERRDSYQSRRSRSRSRERRLTRRRNDDHYRDRDSRSDDHHRDRASYNRGTRDLRDKIRERPRQRSRSRERSHSRDRKRRDNRLGIDKAKLREIAIANAVSMMNNGQMPKTDFATIKSGGKTVGELTDFCKTISEKKSGHGYLSSSDESDTQQPYRSGEEGDASPFMHHPFKVRDTIPNIIMNIRNAKQLPLQSPQEKTTLRLQFPVSSGSQHRAKEGDWVPVEKAPTLSSPPTTSAPATTTAATTTAENDPRIQVFPEPSTVPIDIGSIVSERLQAVRKLASNPNDVSAISLISKAQEQARLWASSKQLPGQFTGSTGAQIMSFNELIGPNKRNQAWAKKGQFSRAAPVQGGIGMALLRKMGWKDGEGLGKNNEGTTQPLVLEFKMDRKGLNTHGETNRRPGTMPTPVRKDLSGKHPVSALVEVCNKRHWGAPHFILVHESGPDHKKNFLFKVLVNNTEYQSTITSNNKKTAKAQAAAACLMAFGLIPREQALAVT